MLPRRVIAPSSNYAGLVACLHPPSVCHHPPSSVFPLTHNSSMGLRMDDLHAPTVASGPTSQPTANGTDSKRSLQELIAQKDNVEAELSALGSVLESVSLEKTQTAIVMTLLTIM